MAELTIKLADGKSQTIAVSEAWVEGFVESLHKSDRVTSVEVKIDTTNQGVSV